VTPDKFPGAARRTTPETAARFEELAGLAERIETLAGHMATDANRIARGEAVDMAAEHIDSLMDRLRVTILDAISIHNSIGEHFGGEVQP
jgi:hypothetical protein